MNDLEFRATLKAASAQMKYGRWRTLLLGILLVILAAKSALSGETVQLILTLLVAVITFQSWALYRAGKKTFEIIEYYGRKIGPPDA